MPVEVRSLSFGEPGRLEVILPGWEDIIHIVPEASVSKVRQEERRRRRVASLSRSPTPNVAQNFAKIAQQIDNVQDALVTLSVAGRVATKIAGRAIPGVGQVAAAADVLNVINVFYPRNIVGGAVGAIRRTGRKISGRSKYFASKKVKRDMASLAGLQTGTYSQRLKSTLKSGKVGFGWGEALQILQTSDELVGVGLSLGPIFGAMIDTFFGLLRGARYDLSGPLGLTLPPLSAESLEAMKRNAPGEYDLYRQRFDVAARRVFSEGITTPAEIASELADRQVRLQVDFVGLFPLVDHIYGQKRGSFERDVETVLSPLIAPAEKVSLVILNAIGAVKKATVNAAVAVFRAQKWVHGLRDDLTWEEHIELMVAEYLALQEIRPFLEGVDWGEFAAEIAIANEDDDFLEFVGLPPGASRGEASAHLRDSSIKGPLSWLKGATDPLGLTFSESLVLGYGELLLEVLEGDPALIEVDSGSLWRSVTVMHDYDLLPPYDREDRELESYLVDLASMLDAGGGVRPSFAGVRTLWVRSFPGGEAD